MKCLRGWDLNLHGFTNDHFKQLVAIHPMRRCFAPCRHFLDCMERTHPGVRRDEHCKGSSGSPHFLFWLRLTHLVSLNNQQTLGCAELNKPQKVVRVAMHRNNEATLKTDRKGGDF